MIRRAAAAAAAAFALQAFAGTPVAFVADVSGSATIAGDGTLSFLAELDAGTRLFLGTGARAAITFARSGSEFTATGPGEFLVMQEELRAEKGAAPTRRDVAALRDATTVTRVARTATASLRMRSARPASEAPAMGTLEMLPAERRAIAERSRASARTFSERVMHAVLLQDLGADQDARAAWGQLARERPDLPELAALAR